MSAGIVELARQALDAACALDTPAALHGEGCAQLERARLEIDIMLRVLNRARARIDAAARERLRAEGLAGQ